jgi:hypothetical protein
VRLPAVLSEEDDGTGHPAGGGGLRAVDGRGGPPLADEVARVGIPIANEH